MRIIACITAKDEAATIAQLVYELQWNVSGVVVVNDGSRDDTGPLASLAGAQVLAHPYPWGIGPSLLHAWRVALDLGADRIVQMDAGGSHSVINLSKLLRSSADLVIGSRFVRGAHYEGRAWRAYCSRIAAIACNLRTGASIRDWTSGYRVFTRSAIEQLIAQTYHARMHGWQIEVLGHALHLDLSIEEVPITYRAGESSFRWKHAKEALSAWSRL